MVFNSRPFVFYRRLCRLTGNAYATHHHNNNTHKDASMHAIHSAQVTCRPAILDLV